MRTFSVVILVLAASAMSLAQEWTQWRGPARDGVIPAAVVPKQWPAGIAPAWSVDIGEGYASPVIAGGRVFLHSRRDPNEIVTAVEIATGKVAWQQTYQSEFKKNQYATQMAKGPNSTPLVAGNRLYTLGVTGILTAWNTADGSIAWRNDYSSSIDTSKLFCGTAMSPMLEGGSLIVQVGSDVHGGRVLALDPATGKERWASTGLGPGYASPVAVSVDNVRQIITMTNSSIIGIDAASGSALWSIPFPDEWHENIVTPIWTGNALIVSGTRQGTHAYALSRTADTWQPKQVWKNPEVTMYTVSPVFADGIIYGMSNKRRGHFVALDAASGAVKWASQGRDGNHASILQTRDHVVFLTDGGALIVTQRTSDGFKELKRYEVSKSPTWTLPFFLPDGLLIREAGAIVKLTWS
jgi:outer membrane protein assembly factor BamB